MELSLHYSGSSRLRYNYECSDRRNLKSIDALTAHFTVSNVMEHTSLVAVLICIAPEKFPGHAGKSRLHRNCLFGDLVENNSGVAVFSFTVTKDSNTFIIPRTAAEIRVVTNTTYLTKNKKNSPRPPAAENDKLLESRLAFLKNLDQKLGNALSKHVIFDRNGMSGRQNSTCSLAMLLINPATGETVFRQSSQIKSINYMLSVSSMRIAEFSESKKFYLATMSFDVEKVNRVKAVTMQVEIIGGTKYCFELFGTEISLRDQEVVVHFSDARLLEFVDMLDEDRIINVSFRMTIDVGETKTRSLRSKTLRIYEVYANSDGEVEMSFDECSEQSPSDAPKLSQENSIRFNQLDDFLSCKPRFKGQQLPLNLFPDLELVGLTECFYPFQQDIEAYLGPAEYFEDSLLTPQTCVSSEYKSEYECSELAWHDDFKQQHTLGCADLDMLIECIGEMQKLN